MSNITNRFVLVPGRVVAGGARGPAEIVPLVSSDDTVRGNGVLASRGRRVLPGATATTFLAAFFRRDGAHCVAIDHGIRLMMGGASPCFVEARNMADGTLYVFGGAEKRAILTQRMESAGFDMAHVAIRLESKGGLYLTPHVGLTEEQASALCDILCGPDYAMNGGGNGYVSDARLGTQCGDVDVSSIAPPVAAPKVAKDPNATKGKAGRPKGSSVKSKTEKGGEVSA